MVGRVDPLVRFEQKFKVSASCWIWTAYRDRDGYGTFWVDGRQVRAHRFAYEAYVGPIPLGLTIDHVRARGCRSRACVNPAHLEPVTVRENTCRGDSARVSAARQLAKTACPHGHPYAGRNLVVDERGKRRCRTCSNAKARRYRNKEA